MGGAGLFVLQEQNTEKSLIVPVFVKVNLSEELSNIVKEQKYEITASSLPCLGKVQVNKKNIDTVL